MSSIVHSATPVIILVVVIAIVVLRRQRRQRLRKQHHLKRNQRAVNLWQQWLDPVVELVVVGGVLVGDLQHGLLPWLALLVGVLIGLPVGAVRGRFMYVSSIEGSRKVVIERNAAEIGVLLALVAIKIGAHSISAQPTSAINLVAIALLGIGLASSVGRVIYITLRHHQASGSSVDPHSPA